MHPDFGRLVRPLVLTSAGFLGLLGVAAASATTALGIGGASVSTAIHNASHAVVTSVPAGTTVHDSVSVVGPLGTPTGTVTVSFFSNGTCSGTALGAWTASLASAGLDTAAVDVTASAMTPGAPGSVSYRATYNGNTTYAKATGACEPLTVTRALPKLTSSMQLSNGKIVTGATVVIGTQVFMHVTVSGSFGTPTGTVQVEQYTGSTCTTTATVQFLTLSGGALVTPAFSPPLGTYAFRAVYQGNATYASISGPCMSVTWVKATPSVGLNVFGTNDIDLQPLVGGNAHGIVSVTGSIGTPTGSVTVTIYGSDDCTGLGRPIGLTLSNGAADTASTNRTDIESAPTVRSWIAVYGGDAKYLSRSSLCMVVRWKANPTGISANFEDHVNQQVFFPQYGTAIHLAGKVTGDFGAPDGDMTSTLYADGACTMVRTGATFALSNGVADPVSPAFILEPGSYSYRVQYLPSTSSSYFGLTGQCVPFTVLKAPTFAALVVEDPDGLGATPQVGVTFLPVAIIGSTGGTVTGPVTFTEYLGADCSSSPVATAADIPLVGGRATAPSLAMTPTTTGEVSYQVTYAATAHFESAEACRAFEIVGAGATAPPTPAPTASTSTQPASSGQPGATVLPGGSAAPASTLGPGETAPAGASGGAPGTSGGAPGTSGLPGGPAQSLSPGETAGANATDAAGGPIPTAANLPLGAGDVGGPVGVGLAILVGLLVVLIVAGAWFGLRRRGRPPS